jgi:multidrug efflux pump subunit AcrA (membrane-fusion protein)
VPGRIEKVHVREGDHVVKGAEVAQLDTKRLEMELEATRQDMRRLAEAERYRGLGDEGSAQIPFLQATVAEQNEKKLQADIASTTLRTPITGVILTKDIELRGGEVIQAGTPFAEVAALDAWELQIDVSEKQIGRVEEAIAASGSAAGKDVNFILYSQSSYKLHAQLERHEQISAAAYPREKENVFVVTLQNIDIPPAIQPAMRPGLTGRAKSISVENRSSGLRRDASGIGSNFV